MFGILQFPYNAPCYDFFYSTYDLLDFLEVKIHVFKQFWKWPTINTLAITSPRSLFPTSGIPIKYMLDHLLLSWMSLNHSFLVSLHLIFVLHSLWFCSIYPLYFLILTLVFSFFSLFCFYPSNQFDNLFCLLFMSTLALF